MASAVYKDIPLDVITMWRKMKIKEYFVKR